MSWASSFMAKKQEVGATPSEGRFGSSEGWKTVGSESAFSRPNRNERDNSVFGRPNRTEDRYGGGGGWAKPTVAAPPPPPNVESEAEFPALGGKKVETKAVKPAGFSKLASSWAAQDAEERAAATAAKAEADRIAALEAKEAARYSNLFNRPIKNQVAYVSMADDYNDYDNNVNYNDYDNNVNYNDSWDNAPKGRNAMLDGGNEDNEGWSTK